jgi:hypothetical protein
MRWYDAAMLASFNPTDLLLVVLAAAFIVGAILVANPHCPRD